MSMAKRDSERQARSYGHLDPTRPGERPWPTPIPGVPILGRGKEDRMLKQILDKLLDIERWLDRIEKLLSGSTEIKRNNFRRQ